MAKSKSGTQGVGVNIILDPASIEQMRKDITSALKQLQSISNDTPIRIKFDSNEINVLTDALNKLKEAKIEVSQVTPTSGSEIKAYNELLRIYRALFTMENQWRSAGKNERPAIRNQINDLKEIADLRKKDLKDSPYYLGKANKVEQRWTDRTKGRKKDKNIKEKEDAKTLEKRIEDLTASFKRNKLADLAVLERQGKITASQVLDLEDEINNIDVKKISELGIAFANVNAHIKEFKNKNVKENKPIDDENKAYKKLISNYEKLYSLKKVRDKLGENEKKPVSTQVNELRRQNTELENQIKDNATLKEKAEKEKDIWNKRYIGGLQDKIQKEKDAEAQEKATTITAISRFKANKEAELKSLESTGKLTSDQIKILREELDKIKGDKIKEVSGLFNNFNDKLKSLKTDTGVNSAIGKKDEDSLSMLLYNYQKIYNLKGQLAKKGAEEAPILQAQITDIEHINQGLYDELKTQDAIAKATKEKILWEERDKARAKDNANESAEKQIQSEALAEQKTQEAIIRNYKKIYDLKEQQLKVGQDEAPIIGQRINDLERYTSLLVQDLKTQEAVVEVTKERTLLEAQATARANDRQREEDKSDLDKKNRASVVIDQYRFRTQNKLDELKSLGANADDISLIQQKLTNLDNVSLANLKKEMQNISQQVTILDKLTSGDNLSNKIKRLANFQTTGSKNNLAELEKQYKNFIDTTQKSAYENKIKELFNAQDMQQFNFTLAQANQLFKELQRNAKWQKEGKNKDQGAYDDIIANLNKINSLQNQLNSKGGKTKPFIRQDIEDLKAENQELLKNISNWDKREEAKQAIRVGADRQDAIKGDFIDKQLEEYTTALDKFRVSVKPKIQKLKDDFGGIFKNMDEHGIEELETKIAELDKAGNKKELQKRIVEINAKMQQLRNTGSNAMKELREQVGGSANVFGNLTNRIKLMVEMMGIARVTMFLWNQFKQGIQDVITLDSALTELRITTNATVSQLNQMSNSAQTLAKNLGATVDTVLQVTRVYANLRDPIDEVFGKIAPTVAVANLSNMSGDEVTDIMQGAMEQFELAGDDAIKNTERIADSLVSISSNMAVDFAKGIKEISEGIAVSGSSAKEAGFSLEEYEALLGSVIEKTRLSGSVIGNAFKTIFSRISRVTTDETVADEEISKVEKAYESIGIKIRESNDEFRKTPDILRDLTAVWDSLNSVQKSYIAEQSAGVRQKNIFLNTMNAFTRSQELATQATEANGIALQKNEQYQDSIEGKIKTLKATMTSFWQDSIGSQSVKTVISYITNVIENLTSLINKIGTVKSVFLGLSVILSGIFLNGLRQATISMIKFNAVTGVTGAISTIERLKQGFTFMTTGIKSTDTALKAVRGTIISINAGMIALNASLFILPLILSAISNAKQKKEEEMQANVEYIKTQGDEIKQINALISKKKDILKSSADEITKKQELAQVESQLGKLVPEATTAYNEQNEALETNLELVEKISEEKKKELATKATETIVDIEDDVKPAQARLKRNIEEQARLMAQIKEMGHATNIAITSINEETGETFKEEILINGKALASELSGLSTQIQKDQATIDKWNNAVKIVNDTLGTSYPYFEKYTNAIKTQTSAMSSNQTTAQQLAIVQSTHKRTAKELADTYANAITKSQGLDKILDELNKTHTTSVNTINDIIKDYPQLIKNLGNEEELRKQLVTEIANQQDVMKQAYYEMIADSTSFYNKNVEGHADMINQLKVGMDIDLSNAKSLAQARETVEAKLISNLSSMWAGFYTIQADGMASLNVQAFSNRMGWTDLEGNRIMPDLMTQAQTDINNYNQKIKDIANTYKNIAAKLSGVNWTKIGSSLDSASKNAQDEVEKIQKENEQEALNLQSNIVNALKKKYEEDKNNELKVLKEKRDNRKKYYEDEIKKLQDEIKALQDDTEEQKQNLDAEKAQLALWQKDDSVLAQQKVKELQKDIAEKEKELAIKQKESEINDLEEKQKSEEDAFDKEEQDIQDHYDKLLEDKAIYEEANKMITQNKQEEIVALLMSYAPKYADIGYVLGKSMADAMSAEVKKGVQAVVDLGGNVSGMSPTSGSGGGGSTSSSGTIAWDGKYYRLGSKGDTVKRIQKNLNAQGYSLAEDGIFGQKTLSAVLDFQRKNGLKADGVIGSLTWAKLIRFNSGGYTGAWGTDGKLAILDQKERVLTQYQNKAFENLIYNIMPKLTNADGIKNASNSKVFNAPMVQNDITINNASEWEMDDNFNNLERMIKNQLKLSGQGIPQMI